MKLCHFQKQINSILCSTVDPLTFLGDGCEDPPAASRVAPRGAAGAPCPWPAPAGQPWLSATFTVALFTTAEIWEQPKSPHRRQLGKEEVVHTQWNITRL